MAKVFKVLEFISGEKMADKTDDEWVLLCIDPGTRNLVIAVFKGTSERDLKLLQWEDYDVGTSYKKMADTVQMINRIAIHHGVHVALCEYQAPMGRVVTSRWNIYVEGAMCTCLTLLGLDVSVVSPSASKRKLKLATGNYAMNKKVAFQWAKEKCDGIESHHVADCFIMAYYWMMTTV
jgi:hypothetical protein